MHDLNLFAVAALLASTIVVVVRGGSIAPPCDLSASPDVYCKDFCENRCGFYNTSAGESGAVENLTVYRITPRNVSGIANKNTADAAGDINFVISKKNLTQVCLHDPTATGCDTDNERKDMYGKFLVEIDSQWGPYQMCNPADGWDTGDWKCGINCIQPTHAGCGKSWGPEKNGTGWSGSPECYCNRTKTTVGRENAPGAGTGPDGPLVRAGYPPQCDAGFEQISEIEFRCLSTENTVYKTLHGWSFASVASMACQTCYKDDACTGWITRDNRTAQLFTGSLKKTWTKEPCHGAIKHISEWDRGGQWFGIANLGGCTTDGCTNVWYSTPEAGRCPEGAPIGTDGCSWRLVETVKYANASCVDRMADLAVEKHGKVCFDRCPKPLDPITDCYLDCYRNTLMGDASLNLTAIEPKKMIEPWERAFLEDDPENGGCPPIQPTRGA